MKKLLAVLALVSSFSFAIAQPTAFSTTVTAAATNSIFTTPIKLYSITLANTGTNAVTVQLLDSASTALVWTNAKYTVATLTSGNVTNTHTNALGGYETNVYSSVYYFTTVTNAAATNAFTTVMKYTVPASSTVSIVPTSPYATVRGLTMTNGNPGNNSLTLSGSYSKY